METCPAPAARSGVHVFGTFLYFMYYYCCVYRVLGVADGHETRDEHHRQRWSERNAFGPFLEAWPGK